MVSDLDLHWQKSFFWPSHFIWKCVKNRIYWTFWVCQKWNFQQWKSKSDTTLQYILLPHYYCKVVSDLHLDRQKVLFCGYFIFSPISNWNLYCNPKILHSPEKNRAREKTKTVLKSHWHGEQLGNMAITWSWLLYFKNHPTAVTPPPSTLIQFWGPPPLSTKSG